MNDPDLWDQADATERAWNVPYIGEAADALLEHIKDYLPGAQHDPEDTSWRNPYAMYTPIIQSSGMGKSRMVDEMAKSVLVLPMVFRPSDSTGYPPADSLRDVAYLMVRNWKFMLAFFRALFDETASVATRVDAPLEGLEPLDKSKLFAPQFRAYMNHGMSMSGHGKFRQEFYHRVVNNAQELYRNGATESPDSLKASWTALENAIQAFSPGHPSFVVLCFDEIHVLELGYLNLCHALHALLPYPVFSIFLTTSGHWYKHTSPGIPPFCEVGFDQFASDVGLRWNPDVVDTEVKLSGVSSTAHLVKFGRPLWATRYCGDRSMMIRDEIITFAAAKLLGGSTSLARGSVELRHQLACLAQRFPINFLSTAYSSSPVDPQIVQVRSHLRVVLRVDDELENMITISPSEPILSEAAYWLMSTRLFEPATALKNILDGFLVHSGNRGELVVMLLLTLARDKAVGLPDEFGIPDNETRTCLLGDFLSSLFVQAPWIAAVGDWGSSMHELFKDSKVYFSHFVKVHEYGILDPKYLMCLMARGAAILCATCQKGVDIVIPFILRGDVLKEDNMGAILIQVNNDKHYTASPKKKEVKEMTIEGLSSIPTLRFFFALAAKSSCIKAVRFQDKPPDAFYFWVAGLSSDCLLPVKDEGDEVWRGLLDASYGWRRTYIERGRQNNAKLERMTNIRRSEYPGGATDDAHWTSWCDVPSTED